MRGCRTACDDQPKLRRVRPRGWRQGGHDCDVVVAEPPVTRHDRQLPDLRLRDQHPVEWIFMMLGQLTSSQCMADLDRERREVAGADLLSQVVRRSERATARLIEISHALAADTATQLAGSAILSRMSGASSSS